MRLLGMQAGSGNKLRARRSSRAVRGAWVVVAALGFGASANAQLNDDPYFNLFTGSYGTGLDQVTGEGTTIWLCGTSACSGTNTTAGGTGYAEISVVLPNSGAGSGAIDPFLRFTSNEPSGSGPTTEAAYNTDSNVLQADSNFANQAKDIDAGGPQDFNNALVFSTLVKDGYMTFLLDINEPASSTSGDIKNTLRLEELEFFIATSNVLNEYQPDNDFPGYDYNGNNKTDLPPGTPSSADGTAGGQFLDAPCTPGNECAFKFWDMDFAKTVNDAIKYGGVLLDNNAGSGGSGDFDYMVRVPVTLQLQAFVAQHSQSGLGDDLYVYLYNFMGDADPVCDTTGSNKKNQGCGDAEADFEEWTAVLSDEPYSPPSGVPLPPTALLFGAGLLAMVRGRKR